MDLILLIFAVPILLAILCAWVQWFLVSHIKDRAVRLPASLVLPIVTAILAGVCYYKLETAIGWDGLSWGLLYFPWACAALLGTLIGWFCGRSSRKKKEDPAHEKAGEAL